LPNAPKFLLPLDHKKAKKRSISKVSMPAVTFDLLVHPPRHSTPETDNVLRELNSESHAHESQLKPPNDSKQRVELRLNGGGSGMHTIFAFDFKQYYPLTVAESGQENGKLIKRFSNSLAFQRISRNLFPNLVFCTFIWVTVASVRRNATD
jgi:hypothetical protein